MKMGSFPMKLSSTTMGNRSDSSPSKRTTEGQLLQGGIAQEIRLLNIQACPKSLSMPKVSPTPRLQVLLLGSGFRVVLLTKLLYFPSCRVLRVAPKYAIAGVLLGQHGSFHQ